MKRTFVFPIAVTSVWWFALGTTLAQTPGDANGDNLVDVADAVYQVNYLSKEGPPPFFWECGDPTADCDVDSQDLFFLADYVFNGGPGPDIVECGWSEPVNLGPPINSEANDRSISFSSDWKRLALASTRRGSFGNEDVWFSIWDSGSGSWKEAQNCGSHINTPIRDDQPCISADGNRIYYSIWERPGGQADWDIWVITFDALNNRWGAPRNLGANVNSQHSETTPFISFDGSKLYFSSSRYPGGIFVAERNGPEWGKPVWLGPNVNRQLDECEPAVSAEGEVLYFVRWTDEGKFFLRRIWVSYWNGREWGPSFKLCPGVNFPKTHATDPWVSPDGSKLYFSVKAKPGGVGGYDIWVSERISGQPGKRFINREQDMAEKGRDAE